MRARVRIGFCVRVKPGVAGGKEGPNLHPLLANHPNPHPISVSSSAQTPILYIPQRDLGVPDGGKRVPKSSPWAQKGSYFSGVIGVPAVG